MEHWYSNGLKFTCRECGQCCTGEPGYVWVSDDEITTLAEYLGMEPAAFEDRFVRCVGHQKSLIEFPNGDCVFFDTFHQNCKVYALRPVQCRTWPFWDSNLESEEAWDETSRRCKGCNRGKRHTVEEIESLRKERRL
ncbi:MAG: YkgJ family cysteine cluster protein [Planctomycetia bacterium]|nr:YkgJ family cysteine cluster protein [Planctomycetia bacterium]